MSAAKSRKYCDRDPTVLEKSQQLEQSLDVEDPSIDDEVRRVTVREALSQHGIPFLKQCSTVRGLREEHHKGTLKRLLVARSLQAMIDL